MPSTVDSTPPALDASAAASRAFREERRQLVAGNPTLTGLDRIEVAQLSELDWKLTLTFLTGSGKLQAIPQSLSALHIQLTSETGGTLEVPTIVSVRASESTATAEVVVNFRDPRQLHLAQRAGSFLLTLTGLPAVDRFFDQAAFRFGPGVAPAEPSGAPLPAATTTARVLGPPTDFLARDYDSLRRLMLDSLGAQVRGWAERNPADLGVTLVEALAYAGDYLSYYQDAVATEAYLQTARLRPSIRRHGRLVDYQLGEGANARVWVLFEVAGEEPLTLPRGAQLLTESGDLPLLLVADSWQHEQALGGGAVLFETVGDARLDPRLGSLGIYTWGAVDYTLAAGCTSAALTGAVAGLAKGDVVLFEETAGGDGARCHLVRLSAKPAFGVDPATGQAYTLVRWFPEDALPFALPVARRDPDGRTETLALARGNLVLADQGQTVAELLPPVRDPLEYRPSLSRIGLTFRAVPDPTRLVRQPAAAALLQDSESVLPAVTLVEMDAECTTAGELDLRSGPTWHAHRELLESSRFARDFVVEMSEERVAELRFGNGRHGRLPPAGARFEAYYRVGGGPSGNVSAGALRHVVAADPRITGVRNPQPAVGGRAWERLERARLLAPSAFHTQRRCVSPEDYVATAELHPDVLAAAARLRWTGSWNTAYVYLQRRGGRGLDARFLAEVTRLFEARRVASVGLALRAPRWVALAIGLRIGVALHQDPGVVRNRLEDTFSDRRLPDGTAGFFYPDAHGFGEPIYAADLVARASAVPGVASVVVETFARRGETSEMALERGFLRFGPLEIALLRNHPAMPQLGLLTLRLEIAR